MSYILQNSLPSGIRVVYGGSLRPKHNQKYAPKDSRMHLTQNHFKQTRDTENVLYELRKSFKEKKCRSHDCIRPDHKYSRGRGGEIIREKDGKGIKTRNRNNKYIYCKN